MEKILVFLEPQKERLKRTSYELISAGKKLSSGTSAEIYGVIASATEAQIKNAGNYGLSTVYSINHNLFSDYSSVATAKAISQLINQVGFDTILFAGNATGLELAPRVAARIDAGYISDCVELDFTDGQIIARKPVYAGKALITTKINKTKKIFSLRPNVFTAQKFDSPVEVKIIEFTPEITDSDITAKVASVIKNEGKLDVLEADIIVSGGRGIKGPENYHLIENLAKAFGAAVGASRAVVDAGWRPHIEQVGQTGKTVSPTLYVACAISGAVQHLAGMSTSKFIVAINKDKDAPIFKVADYGIVGDIFEVLPKLTEKIESIRK